MKYRIAARAAGAFVGVLALCSFLAWFYTGTQAFMTRTGALVAEKMRATLSTRVDIGGVRVRSPWAVEISALEVYDKQGNTMVKAESVEVGLSLFGVLSGETVNAVTDVTVEKPQVTLIEREGGKWNYEDLRQEGTSSTFRGRVVVHDGRVSVTKRREDGAASAERTEITDVTGYVILRDETVKLSIDAAVSGERAHVEGDVLTAETSPRLSLRVTADAFDPHAVFAASPFVGPVAVDVCVAGTVASPTADGTLRAARGEAFGYAVADARADVAYADGRIAVPHLSVTALDGRISASGEYDAQLNKGDGRVKLSHVDIAALGDALDGAPLTGRVTADLGFAVTDAGVEDLRLYGSFSAEDAAYDGIAIPGAEASFSRDGKTTVLDFVRVKVGEKGALSVEGTITGDRVLNLTYYGSRVDLSLLSHFVPEVVLAGGADFSGTIRGDRENPQVSATFAALHGKCFAQPFETLHGAASGSLDGVHLDYFEMESGKGVNWSASGTIGLTGARRLDLRVDTKEVRAEDLAAHVAPDLPITGNVDNVLTITGTLDNPNVVGYIHFWHGSYDGYLLSGMDGDYTMKDGVLTLQAFRIFSPLVDMVLNGNVILASRKLDLKVTAKELNLERFGGKLPYPISGHGRFDGEIHGTLDRPAFDGKLTAAALDFNGVVITDVLGEVTLRGDHFSFAPLRFTQNGGTYQLRAVTDIKTQEIRGDVDVTHGDLNAICAVLNAKNETVHGFIDGSARFHGTIAAPQVIASVRMPFGDVGGHPITDVSVAGTYRGGVLTLTDCTAKQGVGRFSALGTIDFDGGISMRVSAQQITAGLFSAAAGSPLPIKGMLDAEAQIGGAVAHPSVDASVTVTDGGLGTSTFDTMSALLKLRGGVVEVQQFLVRKQQGTRNYRASARGFIPLQAIKSELGESLTDDDQIRMEISLDDADLGLLPILADKTIDWAIGAMYGKLSIGGTLASPRIDGKIGIRDGAVKLKAMELPITNLRLGVVCEGDTVRIQEGTAHLGAGTITLAGETRLAGTAPVGYFVTAEAKKLDIRSPFYRGEFSAKFDLREGEIYGRRLPKCTANVMVDHALISIPTLPESESELPHWILDVTLDMGSHTHFYSSRLYDLWPAGHVRYGGTTHYPIPSGQISVRRGTITYVQTPFTIREGSLLFNQVNSFLPGVLLRADARVGRTKVFLAVDGPTEEMKIHLASSPPMRHEEILKMLTMRGAYRSGKGVEDSQLAASFLEAGLQMSFLNAIEDTMREVLQLDELQISQDLSDKHGKMNRQGREAYNVQIGKYIGKKVMLKYTQGINHDLRRYGARYDFNDRFSVFAARDEREASNIFGFEARLSF